MKINYVLKYFQFKKFCFVSIFTLLLFGCSVPNLPKYELNPSNYKLNSIVKDGLSVSIKPLTDKTEIKKYFGTDLLSKKTLPVFVISVNSTTSSSFILFKDKISLRRKDAHQTDDPELSKGRSAGETALAVVGVGVICIASPAINLIGLGFAPAIAQSNEIEHNILSKELQTKTLSPENKIQG